MSQPVNHHSSTNIQSLIEDLRRPLALAIRQSGENFSASQGLEVRLQKSLVELWKVAKGRKAEDRLKKLGSLVGGFSDDSDTGKRKRLHLAMSQVDALRELFASSNEESKGDGALEMSVQYLKGVGPKVAELMAGKGIITVRDLLYCLPRRYEDRRRVGRIGDLVPGEYGQATGTIAVMGSTGFRRGRPYSIAVQDESGVCLLTWFHYGAQSIPKRFAVGDRIRFGGKLTVFKGKKQIVHPDLEPLEDEQDLIPCQPIVGIYPEINGITKKKLVQIIQNAASRYAKLIQDPMPDSVLREAALPKLGDALHQLHFPDPDSDVDTLNQGETPERRRLVFDEFFYIQIALAQRWMGGYAANGFAHRRLKSLAKAFYDRFPHSLTNAQRRVVGEIVDDLCAPRPMNRLLQGDVGSGKTIVAVLTALMVVENGRQVALMAPTEILAEQHYKSIKSLLKGTGVEIELLTADIRKAEKEAINEMIASGEIDLVVGTHALIQKTVNFCKLGYVIIDEQHRFGVRQRLALREKGGITPDCLVMTATPIPRSLSLTVYGDLDISTLDELPSGRQPITTKVLWMSEQSRIESRLREELLKGRQAYVVAPLVSESEKMDLANTESEYQRFLMKFPEFRIGLLHGRLPTSEKEEVMARFAAGEIDILVATTVVEVGVDVPNVTFMAIQHAERFGLSQLHQLRGRIGRGEHPSICYLMVEKVGEDARERLAIMEKTTDGFLISEKDLEIRGPGDFLGTRQVGVPIFQHANLLRDQPILQQSRRIAFDLVKEDPQLTTPENRFLREMLETVWVDRLAFLRSG